MRSSHMKQRDWRRNLDDKYEERRKGETPASVHPSEIQPFTIYQKEKGVTVGNISNVTIVVKRTGKHFAALWTWVRCRDRERDRDRSRQGF